MNLVVDEVVEFVLFLSMFVCTQELHCTWSFCVHKEMEEGMANSGLLNASVLGNNEVLSYFGNVTSKNVCCC